MATRIAEFAESRPALKRRIFELCDTGLPPTRRRLLSKVIARLRTEEALLKGLELMHDDSNPAIDYDLWRAIEDFCLEKRPYGDSSNVYTLVPRPANDLRQRLFEMALRDPGRRKSAFTLLGQIEAWRLERGKPSRELRHPAFESGETWPPATMLSQHQFLQEATSSA